MVLRAAPALLPARVPRTSSSSGLVAGARAPGLRHQRLSARQADHADRGRHVLLPLRRLRQRAVDPARRVHPAGRKQLAAGGHRRRSAASTCRRRSTRSRPWSGIPSITEPRATAPVLERIEDYFVGRFEAMGGPCSVLVDGDDPEAAADLVEVAADEARRIERKFSRYRRDNVVHEINHAAGRPVAVDEETAQLLDYAATCWEMSRRALRRHLRRPAARLEVRRRPPRSRAQGGREVSRACRLGARHLARAHADPARGHGDRPRRDRQGVRGGSGRGSGRRADAGRLPRQLRRRPLRRGPAPRRTDLGGRHRRSPDEPAPRRSTASRSPAAASRPAATPAAS